MEWPFPFRRVAWTGGSWPTADALADPLFRDVQRWFLREQLTDWNDYWKDWPDADTRRIFRRRATSDAWATYRDLKGLE